VTGTDDQSEYIRRALDAKKDFGEEAQVLVKQDTNGDVVGALGLVKHEDDGMYIIDYLGSKGGGSGTELVKEAARVARDDGLSLYAEPTATSAGFWEKIGFEDDPDGIGSPFMGISHENLESFISV